MILFTGCATLSTYSPKGKVDCDIDVKESYLEGNREAVEFNVITGIYEEFVSLYVYNSTKERIYIEWENARCNGGKVAFSDDRRITMSVPKQDEAVSGFSYSLTREITSKNNVMDDYLIPLYRKENLIKEESSKVYLLIPIRFSNGKVVDYHITLTYKWIPSIE